MKTELIYVTPSFAKSMLNKNASFQRNVSKHVVKLYAEAMKRGEWRVTHQGIATDSNGYLIDGQHRLHAVIEAKMTIPMTLFSGVPESSFGVLDIGKKRDISDLLSIPKGHAAVVNRVGTQILAMSKPSSDQAREIYESLQNEIGYVFEVTGGSNKNVLTTASSQTAFLMHILQNPDDVTRATSLYKNMIAYRIEELPPVGIALVSQVARGAINSSSEIQRRDVMIRVLYALDKSKENVSRVNITNDFTMNKILELRELMRNKINNVSRL